MKKVCFVVISLMVLSACSSPKTSESELMITPTVPIVEEDNTAQVAETPPKKKITDDAFAGQEKQKFELSAEEQALYDEYVQNMDVQIFKDVPPQSILKIYINCGINGAWEPEYNLFAPDTITMPKDEFKEMNDTDIMDNDIASRRSMANVVFGLADDGEFVELDDTYSYWKFLDSQEQEVRSYFCKNEDGILLLKFNPFDPPSEE